MENKQVRREKIKAFNQLENEASQRRMETLRGDVQAKRRQAKRKKMGRQFLLILIVAFLATLAYFIYISMFAGG
jgi:type II secretory pathway component PulL